MIPKKYIPIVFVVVVLLIGAGMWFGVFLSQNNSPSLSPYTAVYLTTGDIYFGMLSQFPTPNLTNVWFLQRSADPQNPQLSIAPLVSTFWGPADKLSLNPKEIIFSVRLRADSRVAQCMANPEVCQGEETQQVPQNNPTPANQSSSKGSTTPPTR